MRLGGLLAMVGLVPIALHATGAGYEAQGAIVLLAGLALILGGAWSQRSSERASDRRRVFEQFASVRTSPFAAGPHEPGPVAPRRIHVPSHRLDVAELEAGR